jgi:hypothetical protein
LRKHPGSPTVPTPRIGATLRSVPLLLCVGVVALAAGWSRPQVPVVTKTVSIDFNCTSDGATISIRPWRVALASRTDEIQWDVKATGLDSVAISPKLVARWPFSTNPPIHAHAQKPGKAKGIPNSVPGGRYQYNITGICNRAGGTADTVIVDPDMIIPKLPGGT